MNLAVIENARALLPSQPLRETEAAGFTLFDFDVAIAVNLDEPYRHAQDILWLQVMAANAASAVECARTWVLGAHHSFESTGLVRRADTHPQTLGVDAAGLPLTVFWSAPVLAGTSAGAVVRHPVSGLRIGFVAHAAVARRWLPQNKDFCLLSRKPTSTSDPAGVSPYVSQAMP
jgi:hypothetical protein